MKFFTTFLFLLLFGCIDNKPQTFEVIAIEPAISGLYNYELKSVDGKTQTIVVMRDKYQFYIGEIVPIDSIF